VVGDIAGHLYASSNTPDYLVQIAIASGQVTKVVGTGTSGYNPTTDPDTGLPLPGTSVRVNQPRGLSVGLNGDVLFADTNNHLVRAYVPGPGHVIDLGGLVVNGTPQGGSNGDGRYADQTELNQPQAVTATRSALYVVADTRNTRLRQLGPSPVADQAGEAARRQHVPVVIVKQTTLRHRPHGQSPPIRVIYPNEAVVQLSVRGKWIEVRVPDSSQGAATTGWLLQQFTKPIARP
jgi:hypothetical protein